LSGTEKPLGWKKVSTSKQTAKYFPRGRGSLSKIIFNNVQLDDRHNDKGIITSKF
jgi:hypothetical protein